MEKMKTVLFEQEAVALGRNGIIKQFGVEAWLNSDTKAVRLTPTGKNGEPRNGWLDLERAKLPQILAAICETSADKDPEKAIAVAIHAATLVALGAIKARIGDGQQIVLSERDLVVRQTTYFDKFGAEHDLTELPQISIIELAHIVCQKHPSNQ